MATFFGEVLPVFSRAVDDEEDDETEVAEFCSPELKWNAELKGLVEQIEAGNRLPCSTLVIAVGGAASCFTQVYLMGGEFETLAVITTGFAERSTVFERQTLMEKKCHLYRRAREPSQLVCVCNSPVAPEQAFSWTTQLFEHLDTSSSRVCVLTSSTASDYLSDTPPSARSVPFLRALTTCAWEGAPVCPYLEQPNVINGLPAQILTHLHVNKVKAVLYTCYTDTIFLDSRTIKAFLPILRSPVFKDTVQSNPEADNMLKKIATLQSSNTLYL